MKRRIILLVSIVVMLSLLTALLILVLFKEKEPIVLEYWTHEDSAREELEIRLIEEFEREHPDIRINRRVYTSSEHVNIVPAAFEAGLGPDIFSIIQTSIVPLIKNGYISEYNGSSNDIQSKYINDVLTGAIYDGKLYGLPMECTSWVLYLNNRVIKDSEINLEKEDLSTWEGVKALSEKLVKREDGILISRGFDFRYPYYLNFLIPMVNQLGGSIGIVDGKLSIINESAWEKVFDFFKDWGPLGDNLGSPTYINARSVFPSGESAMMLSGLYNENRFQRNNPEFFKSMEWSVHPFPVFKESVNRISSAKYCHYWCVSSSLSKQQQEAAWTFIEFLSEHYEEYLDEVRLLLPRKEVIELLEEKNIPYIDIFIDDLKNGDFIYTGVFSEEVRSLLEESIRNIMLGGQSSAKAVERLKIAISTLPL